MAICFSVAPRLGLFSSAGWRSMQNGIETVHGCSIAPLATRPDAAALAVMQLLRSYRVKGALKLRLAAIPRHQFVDYIIHWVIVGANKDE